MINNQDGLNGFYGEKHWDWTGRGFCVHKPLLDGLLFCGSANEAESFYQKNQDVKLWVSLNQNPQGDLPFDSQNKLFVTKARIIYYPIKDRSIPVYDGFSSLIDTILEYLNNKQKVIINCFGGHGRTGVVLCCVMGKLKPAIPDIIEYCRNIYCKKIVESLEQAKFIFKFLNQEILAKYNTEFNFSPLGFSSKKTEKGYNSKLDYEDGLYPALNCGICGHRGGIKYEASLQMYLCKKCRKKFYATGKI